MSRFHLRAFAYVLGVACLVESTLFAAVTLFEHGSEGLELLDLIGDEAGEAVGTLLGGVERVWHLAKIAGDNTSTQ